MTGCADGAQIKCDGLLWHRQPCGLRRKSPDSTACCLRKHPLNRHKLAELHFQLFGDVYIYDAGRCSGIENEIERIAVSGHLDF